MKSIYVLVALVSVSFFSCKSTIGVYGDPKQRISIEDSKQLYNNFNNGANPRGEDETKYTWISLDEMKRYIKFLEKVGRKNNKPISGIAIYYGKYGNDEDFTNEIDSKNRDVPRFGDYSNRETVFFNPTYRDDAMSVPPKYEFTRHKPFAISATNPEKPLIGKYVDVPYKDDTNNPETMSLLRGANELAPSTITSLNENELNAIPPRL